MVLDALQAASGVVEETDPNGQIDLSNQPLASVASSAASVKKKKQAAAPRKRVKEEPPMREPDTLENVKRTKQAPQEKALLSAWIEIQATNKQLQRAISNFDWDPIRATGVLAVQSARYDTMYRLLSSGGADVEQDDDDNVVAEEDEEDEE